jgi:hypothetical protein
MEKNVMLNIEIQVSDEESDNIVIREDDDIDKVVNDFCLKHKLNSNIKKVIMEQLMDSLCKHISECK